LRFGNKTEKGREPMKNKQNTIFLILLLLAFNVGLISGCSRNKDYSNVAESPNISIPGYESLEFKADKVKQSVDFYNPEENTCYFRISLVVDGNSIWTSDLIEPGDKISTIKLNEILDVGTYSAVLQYECFSLKDKSPLNGSNIELTINVN